MDIKELKETRTPTYLPKTSESVGDKNSNSRWFVEKRYVTVSNDIQFRSDSLQNSFSVENEDWCNRRQLFADEKVLSETLVIRQWILNLFP